MGKAVKFTFDDSQFRAALREYSKATGKTDAKVLARAARNTAFSASADAAVREAVDSKFEWYQPAQKGDWADIPYGGSLESGPRLLYAAAAKRGKLISNKEAMDQWNRRVRSKGYLKAFWIAVAKVIIQQTAFVGASEARLAARDAARASVNKNLIAAARKWVAANIKLSGVHKSITFDVSTKSTAEPRMERARNAGFSKAARDMLAFALKEYRNESKKVSGRKR